MDKAENQTGIQSHEAPTFSVVWNKFIMPLKGRTLVNSRGTNKILDVNTQGIIRETYTHNIGSIDIESFRIAYNTLVQNGTVTRQYINDLVGHRCSSGIVLILSQLPFIEQTHSPLGLKLKSLK